MNASTIRPGELLDLKREMVESWESVVGERLAIGFIKSTRNNGQTMFPPATTGAQFADQEGQRIFLSELFMVTEEMVELVEFAHRTLPDDEVLARDTLPSDFGFVFLNGGRIVKDVNSRDFLVTAISWGYTHEPMAQPTWATYRDGAGDTSERELPVGAVVPGIRLTFYTDKYDPRDSYNSAYLRIIETGEPEELAGELTTPERAREILRALPRLVMSHSAFWPFQAQFMPAKYRLVEGTPYDSWFKFLLSTFLLMGQEITAKERPQIERHFVKRARRAKLAPHVTVIMLRRRKNSLGGQEREGAIEWHHRWVVRGHWRKWEYKDGTTGRIWISPYVKGPDDAPLLVTEKVNVLGR